MCCTDLSWWHRLQSVSASSRVKKFPAPHSWHMYDFSNHLRRTWFEDSSQLDEQPVPHRTHTFDQGRQSTSSDNVPKYSAQPYTLKRVCTQRSASLEMMLHNLKTPSLPPPSSASFRGAG